jgi:DNA-binding transcriptional ArsR family regulator
LELLASPARQEIFDALHASGPSSIKEIAGEKGVAPDSLYYHVKRMVASGLVIEKESRATDRRDEIVYDLPDRPMKVLFDTSDSTNARLLNTAVKSMLRLAGRDFENAYVPETAVTEGSLRNIRAARYKAWLSQDELRKVNQLIGEITSIFEGAARDESREMYALTMVQTLINPNERKRT